MTTNSTVLTLGLLQGSEDENQSEPELLDGARLALLIVFALLVSVCIITCLVMFVCPNLWHQIKKASNRCRANDSVECDNLQRSLLREENELGCINLPCLS